MRTCTQKDKYSIAGDGGNVKSIEEGKNLFGDASSAKHESLQDRGRIIRQKSEKKSVFLGEPRWGGEV